MRALVCHSFGPPESLRVDELPEREPGAGQIRVAVHAAGVNFTDVLSTGGRSQLARELPMVPGVELAGIVDAVGQGVTRFAVGQRVLGQVLWGAMAESAVLDESEVVQIPNEMGLDEAGCFYIASRTSDYALVERARMQAGESLLVLGAGSGAGLAAVQIGKALGGRVIAAASSADKLELAQGAGADELIAYPPGPLDVAAQKTLTRELLALSGRSRRESIGKISSVHDDAGFDVIYDGVGGNYAEPALRSLAYEGRYLSVGFAAGMPKVALGPALFKNADIMGIQPSDPHQRSPGLLPEAMERMFGWYRAGRLRPNVTETYDLADGPRAFRRLLDRQARGRIVLTTRHFQKAN